MEKCFENVSIITKEEMLTIGIQVTLDYNVTGHSPIKALWDTWVSEELYKLIPNTINDPETLGVTLDETKEETTVYSICMDVSSLDNIPVGMVGRKYSKSTYAVFKTELYMNYMSNENDEVEIYAPIVK